MTNKQKTAAVQGQNFEARRRIDPRFDSSLNGFDISRTEMPYILKQLHDASKMARQEAKRNGRGILRQEL